MLKRASLLAEKFTTNGKIESILQKIICIDPESKYKDLCLSLGGDWINAVGGSTGMINPLQVRPSPHDDEQEKDADRYKLVKQKADTDAGIPNQFGRQAYADLALLLYDIAEGADSFIWNGKSTITEPTAVGSRQNQFIVLDTNALQETSDSIKRTQYFNILTYCWEQ